MPRDDFSSIAIEVTLVILGHGFKKAGSVLNAICAPRTRTKSPITSLDICIPGGVTAGSESEAHLPSCNKGVKHSY